MSALAGTAWLDTAELQAMGWPTSRLEAVLALMPYPPERNVREMDWVLLVAHVSTTRGEPVLECAQRLALYVKAYAEQHHHQLSPAAIQRSQA